jgi:hypothetical protein
MLWRQGKVGLSLETGAERVAVTLAVPQIIVSAALSVNACARSLPHKRGSPYARALGKATRGSGKAK